MRWKAGKAANKVTRAICRAVTSTRGPFYAILVNLQFYPRWAASRIDHHTRSTTRRGQGLSGLFAAGEVTGGVHGGNRLAAMLRLTSSRSAASPANRPSSAKQLDAAPGQEVILPAHSSEVLQGAFVLGRSGVPHQEGGSRNARFEQH